jgi:hypothetical protein
VKHRPSREQLRAAAAIAAVAAEIALDLAGLVLLAMAGWQVHPALGLAVAGIVCLVLANGGMRLAVTFRREDRR